MPGVDYQDVERENECGKNNLVWIGFCCLPHRKPCRHLETPAQDNDTVSVQQTDPLKHVQPFFSGLHKHEQAGFLAYGSPYLPRLPGYPVAFHGFRPRIQQWLACDGFKPSFLLTRQLLSWNMPCTCRNL
jgi:hypothetical protein